MTSSHSPLPTIDSFTWDRANWTPAESSDRRRIWRNDAGDLMVQQFGLDVPRGLPPHWRDAEALRAHVTPARRRRWRSCRWTW